MRERFARWWCRTFHGPITRPVNGEYICLRCQRRFEALRTMPEFTAKPTPPVNHQGLGGSPASPNAATGLPGPIAGISVHADSAVLQNGKIQWVKTPTVAELERLLSLDKPKRVE